MRRVTFRGKELHLIGRSLQVGDLAPDARVSSSDLNDFSLWGEYLGITILTSFISLDTSVCDAQIKEFHRRVSEHQNKVRIIGLSKDLPFAAKRFCDTFSLAKIPLFSDYKASSFGVNYGVLIREWDLLARAVWIIDCNRIVRYVQIVPEITHPPDYQDLFSHLEEVLRTPRVAPVEQQLKTPLGWSFVENRKLVREFLCDSPFEASRFAYWIGIVGKEQNHCPIVITSDRKVHVTITPSTTKEITQKDYSLAQIIGGLL